MTSTIQKRDDSWLSRPVANGDAMAELVTKAAQQLEQMSIGRLDAARTVRLSLLTKMAARKNPALLRCSAGSLLWSFLDAARCGLEWDGVEGAIVPYGEEARFLSMFQGLIRLATSSGVVRKIVPVVVYRDDEFKVFRGSEDRIHHVPAFGGEQQDSDIIAAYAVATLPSGDKQFEVVDRPAIDRIRAVSKNRDRGPWVDWFPAMSRKTAVRQLWKYLGRRSDHIDTAIEIDDRTEIGDQHLSRALAPADATPPKNRGSAALRAVLGDDEPAPTPPPDEAPTDTHEPTPATKGQLAALAELLDKGGAKTPEARAKICGGILGREVAAATDLSSEEAQSVMRELRGKP